MAAVPTSYKAYIYESYGPIDQQVKLVEIPTSRLPAQYVRIKVHTAALNPADYQLVEGIGEFVIADSPTKERPFRMGWDVAGTIVEVFGVNPRHLQVGDEVYGMAPVTKLGTLAEYVELDLQCVTKKPKNLDFNQAASVPLVAMTSYQAFYEYTQLKQGANQRVLILGGSSATGMYGIQFAKLAGAHVTVTASAKNEALLKSLGADVVIDYHTQKWMDVIEPHSIDIICDCGAEPNAWKEGAQKVLKKEIGEFVTLQVVADPIPSEIGATNHGGIFCIPRMSDLDKITKLFEEGKLKTVVDSIVPFDKVLEGLKHVQSRHALGKVVVKVV